MERLFEMKKKPLCQFGPGGDFRKAYPSDAELPTLEKREQISPRMLAKLADDLGLEPALVCTGYYGVKWQQKSIYLKGVVKSILEVLHEIRPGAKSDEELVAEHIARAEQAIAMLQANPVESQSSCSHGKKATAVAASSAAKNPQILCEAQADAEVAMSSVDACRITAGSNYTVAKHQKVKTQENTNADSNTTATGNSSIYKGLSEESRLFPNNAGDWGSSESYQGYSLRTRRRVGKKRRTVTRRKTQGSLFGSLG